MSLAATAVQYHFQTQHADLDQKDIITFHVEFLARCSAGFAEIKIHELKFGRQFSTVRAQLVQYPNDDSSGVPRICFEATVNLGNLHREAENGGLSLPTRLISDIYSIPKRESCLRKLLPPGLEAKFPLLWKLQRFSPPGGDESLASPSERPSVREEWVRWEEGVGGADGEGFNVLSLPFLADSFQPLPVAYGVKDYWYPTLCYGLDVKKEPPTAKGWEWLFLRVEMLKVAHGRFDMRMLILDEEGELVALGNHTALIVSMERNMKPLGTKI